LQQIVRIAFLAFIASTVAACASSPPRAVDNAEIFDHDYDFDGDIEGRNIRGSISFRTLGTEAVRYTLLSDIGLCSGELRPQTTAWIQLSCGGMSIQFARGGRVLPHAQATLRTTRQETRRECDRWVINDNGQRSCTAWVNRLVDVPFMARGVLRVQRVAVEL
jgi:hypothetical protein